MKLILLLTWLILQPSPQISVVVSPYVCLVPCMVTVDLVIPRHPDNRRATLIVDGPEYRSSEVQLNGEISARRFTFRYANLPEGTYEVKGVLYNSTREVSRRVVTLIIKGVYGS